MMVPQKTHSALSTSSAPTPHKENMNLSSYLKGLVHMSMCMWVMQGKPHTHNQYPINNGSQGSADWVDFGCFGEVMILDFRLWVFWLLSFPFLRWLTPWASSVHPLPPICLYACVVYSYVEREDSLSREGWSGQSRWRNGSCTVGLWAIRSSTPAPNVLGFGERTSPKAEATPPSPTSSCLLCL